MTKKGDMWKFHNKSRNKFGSGDTSWEQWTKRRNEEHQKSKDISAAKEPKLHDGNEIMEKQGTFSEQRKKKRKVDEITQESSKDELRQLDRSVFVETQGTFSEQRKKKRKVDEMNEKSSKDELELLDRSVFVGTQDTTETLQKKKKKMEHEKSIIEQKKVKESQELEVKQTEASEVEQQEISSENQTSTLDKGRNNSVRKAVPRFMFETTKTRDVKLLLAQQGMSFKEWKIKRKEEYRTWKEAKEARKLKLLAKSKAVENCEEEKKETFGKGRNYTVSIALPGSILDNAQSPELKTYLGGQIARAAAVFNVNEIIVFEESVIPSGSLEDEDAFMRLWQKHGSTQLYKILQFLECPQYLRRYFFPLQKDLEFAGVLNPLDMPHHLRINDDSPYREGVTLDKPVKNGKGSYAYIGFQKSAVIDKAIEPNVRVTVKLNNGKQQAKKHFTGVAVSPSTPYRQDGIYWGYSVRLAENLGAVFSKCPFKEGYDLTIGTSDKGEDVDHCVLPSFKHLLIVFGGLKGLETSLEADETLPNVDDPRFLFHHYLNTCPSQGSRTIRTEEAILITLSVLRPKILHCQTSSI